MIRLQKNFKLNIATDGVKKPHKTKKITKLNYHSEEKLKTVKLRSKKTAEWRTKALLHTGGSTTFFGNQTQTVMNKVI